MSVRVDLEVNGQRREVEVAPGAFLLDVLRDQLDVLDCKEACDEGECGACAVLIDGLAVDSCIYLAAQCDGRAVTTVAGLAPEGGVHPLQQAFVDHGAVQCGFCTPGFLVTAAALLQEGGEVTEEDVRLGLAGNLCRCTGYSTIVGAVMAVAADCDEREEAS